jgi:hypothetical protein
MALILAIEPDRRQASQLTAMVRGRLHAELVLAESAERALTALGDRVPDLVLTSALLSPKDETALGDRLRALDGQAAHVQTLTIPVLATTSSRGGGRAGGVLSALRREKSKPAAHDGCDPAVFAEQCKEYLERAAAERASLLEQAATITIKEPVRPVSPSPVTGTEWTVVREASSEESVAPPAAEGEATSATPDAAAAERVEDIGVRLAPDGRAPYYNPYGETDAYVAPASENYEADASVAAAPDPVVEAEPIAQTASGVLIEPTPDVQPDSPIADEPDMLPRADRVLREFLDIDGEGPASLLAAVAALEAEEQSHAPEAPREELVPEEEPEFLDLSSLLQSAASPADAPIEAAQDEVYEIDPQTLGTAFDADSDPGSNGTAERLATLSDLEDIFRSTPDFAAGPAPAPAQKPKPAPHVESLKEWEDIVEALRRDAEQLEARQPTAGEPVTRTAPLPDLTNLPPFEVPPHVETTPAAVPTVLAGDAAAPAAAPAPSAPAPAAPAAPSTPADAPATSAPAEAAAEQTAAAPADAAAGAKRKRKRSKASPAQDEWGFFDPDQCGFAALIEKLEEINDNDDTPAPRGA